MSLPDTRMPEPVEYDLWKYFNDRMFALKDALLQILTWLMAFALAILGFLVQKDLVGFEGGLFRVQNAYAAGTFSVIGLLLCFYCFYLIYAYGVLINENWVAAGRLRDELGKLTQIYPEEPELRKQRLRCQRSLDSSDKKIGVLQNIRSLPPFCMNVSIPIMAFLASFAWILTNAISQATGCRNMPP